MGPCLPTLLVQRCLGLHFHSSLPFVPACLCLAPSNSSAYSWTNHCVELVFDSHSCSCSRMSPPLAPPTCFGPTPSASAVGGALWPASTKARLLTSARQELGHLREDPMLPRSIALSVPRCRSPPLGLRSRRASSGRVRAYRWPGAFFPQGAKAHPGTRLSSSLETKALKQSDSDHRGHLGVCFRCIGDWRGIEGPH